MKKTILLLLLLNQINAQNLISNPGFEKCDLCGRFGNPGVEFGFLNGANNPVDWFGVTEGSSDIRNTLPFMGKRHGGFFSFGKYEYLGNVLAEPLQAGAEYKFSFWLSIEISSGYTLDEIGVFFHKGLPKYTGLRYIGEKLTPNFTTPDNEYIPADKYKQYSFIYKACGGEDHIIIGRFSNLGKNDTMFIGKGAPPSLVYPYTYVDEVELIKTKEAANLLPDAISICKDEIIKIGIPSGFTDVIWSTGAIGDSTDVNTTYSMVYVEAKFDKNCPAIKDSILIQVSPLIKDTIDLITEDTICFRENLVVDATNAKFSKYIWSDNSKYSRIRITEKGIYSVIASGNCFESNDQVVVINGFDFNKLFQFPNVFLPNSNDNNTFLPIVQSSLEDKIRDYQILVYNRWGSKVFESKDYKLA